MKWVANEDGDGEGVDATASKEFTFLMLANGRRSR